MSRRVTASRVGLARECLAWAQPGARWDETPSTSMSLGREIHAAIEGELMGRPLATMSPECSALLAVWKRDVRPTLPTGAMPEVAFAWVPETDTGVELGSCIGRDYSHAPTGALCGAADLVYMSGDAVVVTDWKSGFQTDLEPAQDHAQLRCLALMAARAYGTERAIVSTVHLRPDGAITDEGALDALDLDAIAGELRAWLAGPVAPRPGSHCGRCPHAAACPATARTLALAESLAIGTTADVQRIWPLLAGAEKALDAIKRKIREHVEANGEVPLLSGKRLRLVESQGRESTSVAGLAKVLGPEDMQKLRDSGAIKRGAPSQALREVG